jgi:hypothetical protein
LVLQIQVLLSVYKHKNRPRACSAGPVLDWNRQKASGRPAQTSPALDQPN